LSFSSTADWFFKTFGLATRETPISFFAGAAVETMKAPSFGDNGHIGIAANSPERAAYHLQRQGVEFRAFKCAPDGTLIAAYLTEEIGGFAVHLCPKY
jgi:2-dehydro-3-deoxyphosphogluconate aldolase/(4S)-4-hydroxy-2-oxoglutarate aldolase